MLRRVSRVLGFRQADYAAADQKWLFSQGNTVPTDGTAGYGVGCIFQHRDGGAGTALYINEGSETSCNFDAVSALTAAQEALLGATAGTVTASTAVIVDANKDVSTFRTVGVVNLDAGSSGAVGSVDVFPATASKGKLSLAAVNNDGDTTTTISNAAMGQASVVSIPDPGAATANFVLTNAANDGVLVTATAAELNQLDGNLIADAATTEGAGITGDAAVCEHSVVKAGGIFKTEILLDLTGVESTATDGDIIGDSGGGAAHIGQITAARNGTIIYGTVTCLETPAGGDDDIAIYSATENTGVYDGAIADLAETQLQDNGAWTAAAATPIILATVPVVDEYIYLVAKGGDTAGTYTAGIFLIELWGV